MYLRLPYLKDHVLQMQQEPMKTYQQLVEAKAIYHDGSFESAKAIAEQFPDTIISGMINRNNWTLMVKALGSVVAEEYIVVRGNRRSIMSKTDFESSFTEVIESP